MKNNSNFFLNNFFEFENYSCTCKKETVFSVPGQPPHYNLKICSNPENSIYFSYASQKGLNQSGNAGGIISENILGQLLAIPVGDLNATIDFLEKYGFLFPISSDKYESVDDVTLLEIVNRIKATVTLMGAIAGKRDYKKMLICTTYLLYSSPVTLKLSTEEYSSCIHPFSELIGTYNSMPDINRNQEFFDNEYISISDTFINGDNHIDSNELPGMCSGDGVHNLPGSKDRHYKNLFALYTNYPVADKNLRTIIDFYYHYQKDIGIIKDVAVNKLTYHTQPQRENFTEKMKESLLKIAQIVISEEINANLKGISPQFNIDTLTPSWKLNSFIEALYFSIFYMKPGVELYKECENPNCKHQKYFLINATATNKKYCCKACGNAAAQRRSRQRKLTQK